MKFYKELLFYSSLIFFSCEKYKTISEVEFITKHQWNRKEILNGKLSVDTTYEQIGLALDFYYNDEVQYQNIFLHVTLKDAEGNVIFEKLDLMLMLFDPTTGYPLGRKIFRKQHLEFIIVDDLKLSKGDYYLEISQKTRSENLYGIEKISGLFISVR